MISKSILEKTYRSVKENPNKSIVLAQQFLQENKEVEVPNLMVKAYLIVSKAYISKGRASWLLSIQMKHLMYTTQIN